ncbi:MAG: leucine-rich repeat protein, partial [Agathobacter sp.]|nr:leucine-rich repeat protein [Agathobacter sp.]
MMKRIIAIIMAITLVMGNNVSMLAEEICAGEQVLANNNENVISGDCGKNITWTLSEGILNIKGRGVMTDYAYEEFAPWYSHRKEIINVVISDEISSIGNYAFYNCENIKTINIPNGVNQIGSDAFRGCKRLSNITIPKGVTAIGYQTFSCSGIKSIDIPETVTTIDYGAFYNCSNLSSIILPDGLVSIEDNAFSDCSNLANIEIPSSLTSFGANVFEGTKWLEEQLEKDSFVVINGVLVKASSTMESAIIPNEVSIIGELVFDEDSILKKVVINEQVKVIKNRAFVECKFLTDVYITESTTDIAHGAFEHNISGGRVVIHGKAGSYAETFANNQEIYFVWTDDVVENDYELIIENGVVTGYTGVPVDVEIPENVRSIGSEAFKDCKSLKSINIGNVSTIAGYAFSGCTGLKEVEFGKRVMSIAAYAFQGCCSLEQIEIGINVNRIEKYAFSDCYSLKEVEIPQNVTSFGNMVFSDTEWLLTKFEESPVVIVNNILIDCDTTKKEFHVPDGVTTIASFCFFNGIRITIPESVINVYNWSKIGTCDDVIIYGKRGSTAHSFAENNGFIFKDKTELYTVTFDVNGGVNLNTSNKRVEQNESIGKLPDVERDGYVFVGWYTTENGGVRVTEDMLVTSDITIYAHWETEVSSTYTATSVSEFQSNHKYLNNQDTTWIYTVADAKSLSIVFNRDTEVEADYDFIILYDKRDKVIGTYNGTQLAGQTIVTRGDTIKVRLISDDSVNGYGFKVDSVVPSYTGEDIAYTVTFNANGGTKLSTDTKEIEEDQVVGTLPTVEREGYTFKGWYTDASGGTQITENTVITEDTTFYAQWEKEITSIKRSIVKLSSESFAYDGTEKKPTVTVTCDNRTLKEGTDYTVSYANNTAVGTATVTITGIGNYCESISKNFTITTAPINEAKVTLSKSSYTYDGKTKKPSVTIKLGDKTLVKDTDYTVTYKNNKNIGKATVTIKGKGNYTGTLTKTFTINAKKGATFTSGSFKYKVTSSSAVAFTGFAKKETSKVTIPKTVKYGG